MASGAADLTARIPVESKDEMGQMAEGINAVVARIQAIVQKVRESSLQLLSTASEIAATAREQDATVQGLSSSTSQVAAAVREITATSKELSSTMDEVNGRAGQAATLAAQGRNRLGNMEKTMGGLVESTASVSAKLSTIRDKADNINVVVTTITQGGRPDQSPLDQRRHRGGEGGGVRARASWWWRARSGAWPTRQRWRPWTSRTWCGTCRRRSRRASCRWTSSATMYGAAWAGWRRSTRRRGRSIDQVDAVTDRFHQVTEGMRNQSIGAEQINEAMASMTGNIRQTATSLEEFNRGDLASAEQRRGAQR